mgnify:CR=1 FL=1
MISQYALIHAVSRRQPGGPIATRALMLAAVLSVAPLFSCAQAEQGRVLVIVVDGLRPDYVTAEVMPRLDALARGGVRGLAHHVGLSDCDASKFLVDLHRCLP